MARHRLCAQSSLGQEDDGQVKAPRRSHRMHSQTSLECLRNDHAVKMILKDPIRKKRPVSAFLLFSRDFKKTAMGNNGKKLSYKAAIREAKLVWKEMSDYEKDPYIKEYHKDYVDWKKRSVMPPQVYDSPGQEFVHVSLSHGQSVGAASSGSSGAAAVSSNFGVPPATISDNLGSALPSPLKQVSQKISRRTGSAEFLQQLNEIARDNAKNAPAFAYGKDKKVTDDCRLFKTIPEGPSRCSEQAVFDQTPGPQFDRTPGPIFDQIAQFLKFNNESPVPSTSLGPLFDATPAAHAARI